MDHDLEELVRIVIADIDSLAAALALRRVNVDLAEALRELRTDAEWVRRLVKAEALAAA